MLGAINFLATRVLGIMCGMDKQTSEVILARPPREPMGRHRYAGRRSRKHLNPFRADSALAATFTRIFGPDWFLTGRALIFCPVENPVTLGVRVRQGKRCWQTSEVMFH